MLSVVALVRKKSHSIMAFGIFLHNIRNDILFEETSFHSLIKSRT
jgi:hypothetical protein